MHGKRGAVAKKKGVFYLTQLVVLILLFLFDAVLLKEPFLLSKMETILKTCNYCLTIVLLLKLYPILAFEHFRIFGIARKDYETTLW